MRTGDYSLVVPLSGVLGSDPVPPPRTMPKQDFGSVEADLATLTAAIPRAIRGGPRGERLLPRFEAPATGRLVLTLFGWGKQGRVKIGGGSLRLEGWSSDHLGFRLNQRGRALLRRPQRTRVKAVLKYTPAGAANFRRASEFFVKAPAKKRKRR